MHNNNRDKIKKEMYSLVKVIFEILWLWGSN